MEPELIPDPSSPDIVRLHNIPPDETQASHPIELGAFRLFGGIDPGLKARDLIMSTEVIRSAGLKVSGCPILAAEQFTRFMESCGYTPATPAQKVLETPPLPELTPILLQILSEFPAVTPVAIRSSARSERGGLGIYESNFLLLTGEAAQDIKRVWNEVLRVYASEFSGDAVAWRTKTGAEMGVAVMFHPLVGSWHGSHFFPLLAGRGYSSLHGKPLIRAVAGIATEDSLATMGAFCDEPNQEDFVQDVKESQKTVWAIDLGSAAPVGLNLWDVHRWYEAAQPELEAFRFGRFFDALAALQGVSKRSWYVEFAVAKDRRSDIEIVQCAPVEDEQPKALAIDTSALTEVACSRDIVNHGVREGRGIIWLGRRGWQGHELTEMEALNQMMRNYAVFVRQNEFSALSRIWTGGNREREFGYRHFSNAGVVCERQFQASEAERRSNLLALKGTPDHTGSKGGLHFAQLCKRGDILFLGADFDSSLLPGLPGAMEGKENVAIWDVEWIAVNDARKGEGVFYLKGMPRTYEYTHADVLDYADHCHERAGHFERHGKEDIAKAFYDVCYLIPVNGSPIGFDPFAVNLEEASDLCDKEGALREIEVVLQNSGGVVTDVHGRQEMSSKKSFRKYLLELRERIGRL